MWVIVALDLIAGGRACVCQQQSLKALTDWNCWQGFTSQRSKWQISHQTGKIQWEVKTGLVKDLTTWREKSPSERVPESKKQSVNSIVQLSLGQFFVITTLRVTSQGFHHCSNDKTSHEEKEDNVRGPQTGDQERRELAADFESQPLFPGGSVIRANGTF